MKKVQTFKINFFSPRMRENAPNFINLTFPPGAHICSLNIIYVIFNFLYYYHSNILGTVLLCFSMNLRKRFFFLKNRLILFN